MHRLDDAPTDSELLGLSLLWEVGLMEKRLVVLFLKTLSLLW